MTGAETEMREAVVAGATAALFFFCRFYGLSFPFDAGCDMIKGKDMQM